MALPLLAVTVAFLPAVLLGTAALQPSELAERLIAGIGSLALALATLRLARPYGALAIAGAVSVLGYAVDVVAGSTLTALSLMGPNPALGVRFFGIGNELEATLVALVPIATGAALVAWAPRISPRGAALTFALTGLVAVAAFAPGQFGADVGAAIGIPVGAAVAVAACLGATRRRLLMVVAAPIVVLAALGAADLGLGGDAHLTRSVLEAGGFDQLADVAERRLRLSARKLRPLRRHADALARRDRDRRRDRAAAPDRGLVRGPAHRLGGTGGSGSRHRGRDARQRLGGPGADDRHRLLCADRGARLGHAATPRRLPHRRECVR